MLREAILIIKNMRKNIRLLMPDSPAMMKKHLMGAKLASKLLHTMIMPHAIMTMWSTRYLPCLRIQRL